MQNIAFRRGLFVQEDLEVYDKAPMKKQGVRWHDGASDKQNTEFGDKETPSSEVVILLSALHNTLRACQEWHYNLAFCSFLSKHALTLLKAGL